MDRDEIIRDLMAKLMEAVEASLSASSAVREALAELTRSGYEARLFFVANAEEGEGGEEPSVEIAAEFVAEAEASPAAREVGAAPEGSDVRFELTKLDQDFLKSVHIRPEGG